MDLNELRTVRRTEREKDSLQHLRDSFYEDVAAYLADLEARRERAAAEADDPFASPEVRKLTDKIETAEEVSEAIYERRVGKIVKQASFAAADMTADRDGLTQQEADLFDDLVTRIKENKTTVLNILAGENGTISGEDDAIGGEDDATGVDAIDDDGSISESESAGDAVSSDAEPGDMLASAMGGENAAERESEARAGRDSSGRDFADHDSAAATGDVSDDGAENSHASNATQATNSPPATGEDRTAVEPAASPPGSPATDADVGTEPTNDAPTTDPKQRDAATAPETDSDSDENGDGNRTPTTDGGASQLQRTTVRITRDVGAILGVDEREYDLEREDVVTLPATNAEPLVERDAAERLE